MKIELWWIGKTNEKYLHTGINIFEKRIKHYNPFKTVEFKDIKNFRDVNDLRKKETVLFEKKLDNQDLVILLDEKGQSFSSLEFAHTLEKWMQHSIHKRIVFIITGAFGAGESIKKRANILLSCSDFTFSHQMVRLIFLEQLYRAFTIIKNEKYHNE